MSYCGYDCPGCPSCDPEAFGLVPMRNDPVWGYHAASAGGYGGVADDVRAGLEQVRVFTDEVTGALPPSPSGAPDTRPPPAVGPEAPPPASARTPITVGDAVIMGTGGLLLGRAVAALFSR